jgi:hypothetical protein
LRAAIRPAATPQDDIVMEAGPLKVIGVFIDWGSRGGAESISPKPCGDRTTTKLMGIILGRYLLEPTFPLRNGTKRPLCMARVWLISRAVLETKGTLIVVRLAPVFQITPITPEGWRPLFPKAPLKGFAGQAFLIVSVSVAKIHRFRELGRGLFGRKNTHPLDAWGGDSS